MEIRTRFLFVVSISILLSACAVSPYNHLDEAARAQLSEVDTYLVVPQDEIYAQIDQSNIAAAGGGGLLLALIDVAVENARTKTAEEMIQPIRNQLLDFDYPDVLVKNINSALKSVGWLHAKDIVLLRSEEQNQLADLYNKSGASAILYITADYSLTGNFHSAATKVSIAMYPKVDSLTEFKERNDNNTRPTDQTDNIYRNNFEYTNVLVTDPKEKKEDAAAELAAASPAKLIDALSDNAVKIADMIKEDIAIAHAEKDK